MHAHPHPSPFAQSPPSLFFRDLLQIFQMKHESARSLRLSHSLVLPHHAKKAAAGEHHEDRDRSGSRLSEVAYVLGQDFYPVLVIF